MSAWIRKRTLIAGIALIALTNAIALTGVAYNRSGQPDSVLKLTQRELNRSYSSWSNSDNSGIALSLRWRLPTRDRNDPDRPMLSHPFGGGSVLWLDKAKLSELGFDVSQPVDTERGRRFYQRELPHEVLLVLELDGEAYQQSLRITREYAAQQAALRTANPGKKEFEDRARRGDELVKQEVDDNSRLFVVDAGLDAAALRAKYPDSSKYAITRGRVLPSLGWESKSPELNGVVSELSISELNVPSSLREHFTGPQHQYAPPSASPYEVTLAIGKRLEPWITAVTRTAVQ